MKIKTLIIFLVLISLICVLFVYAPQTQAVFSINPTVRNGEIYINEEKQTVTKIATFGGTAYVPLNLLTAKTGITYSPDKNENVVSFTYKGNALTLDFNKKTSLLNGQTYELLYGTSKMTDISEVTYIFLGTQDIQNIFGIITEYDKNNSIVKLNTGFGVVAVDYSQLGGYQTESNMVNARAKLHTYANNIATTNKGSMTMTDKAPVESLTEGIINSINAPINKDELTNGMRIKGLASYDNINNSDLNRLMQIRFMASLAGITVSSEYVRVYEINNYNDTVYVVGLFFAYEGLDMRDDDLATSAIATIEDTLKASVTEEVYSSIATKVKTIVKELRNDNQMLVCYIKNGKIRAAGLM